MCRTSGISNKTIATCIPKTQMKHTAEIYETLETYYCNMPLKVLQHMQQVQHPPIYFCNIYMIQFQHASEAIETIET